MHFMCVGSRLLPYSQHKWQYWIQCRLTKLGSHLGCRMPQPSHPPSHHQKLSGSPPLGLPVSAAIISHAGWAYGQTWQDWSFLYWSRAAVLKLVHVLKVVDNSPKRVRVKSLVLVTSGPSIIWSLLAEAVQGSSFLYDMYQEKVLREAYLDVQCMIINLSWLLPNFIE